MAIRVSVQTDCERADTYPFYRALSAFTYWEVELRGQYFYNLEHPLFTRKMILPVPIHIEHSPTRCLDIHYRENEGPTS